MVRGNDGTPVPQPGGLEERKAPRRKMQGVLVGEHEAGFVVLFFISCTKSSKLALNKSLNCIHFGMC